ncbi:hypothetical protein RND71_001434 [Anisodus tanguticus]|uniref:Polygalacturonase n=1 Tax=Anisodus tanguticus TaxID=243964 RepID=A0AAE1T0X4_9SOLA|nr:hypothetical protein RND71_001434 [Anisodus tanguticus]
MASKSYFEIVFILGRVLVCTNAEDKLFSVLSCGARADGATDNSDDLNIDGIHIVVFTNIQVLNFNIGIGDDCISIVTDSQNINISGVTCGPGYGKRIGSLGKTPNDVVKDIHVKNCTLIAIQNGARIKTWASSYVGGATTINFEDIIV